MEINWSDIESEKNKALNFPLSKIFKIYNLNINKNNTKVACPFKTHKFGHEKTPSFIFYHESNTYWCFGCKQGNTTIDFVKNIEGINYYQAVEKISKFDNFSKVQVESKPDLPYEEYFNKQLEFADLLRSKLHSNKDKAFEIMKSFDEIKNDYNLDNGGIIRLIDKLILRKDE